MGVSLSLAYLNQVPKIIDSQIKLRAQVISKSLSAGISQPLLLKNYLAVSKIAAMHANFSDVSYAVVLNKNGIMITGLLSDEKKFSKNFNESLSVSGFPYELIIKNIPENKNNSVFAITLDGKKIYNSATEVGETGGTVHVGVFTDRAQQSIRETFFYLFLIFLAIVFLGSIAAFYIGRTISVPLSRLSIAAKKIAYGEIDTPIEIKGKGEIKILSQALEEMRGSVKSAIYRLRNK
jgi:HAMP domain-containing protein